MAKGGGGPGLVATGMGVVDGCILAGMEWAVVAVVAVATPAGGQGEQAASPGGEMHKPAMTVLQNTCQCQGRESVQSKCWNAHKESQLLE